MTAKKATKMILDAMTTKKGLIDAINNSEPPSTNPQVLEMLHRAQGEYNAYQAVYDALHRDDPVLLSIAVSGRLDVSTY